jgi:hypothetical protein
LTVSPKRLRRKVSELPNLSLNIDVTEGSDVTDGSDMGVGNMAMADSGVSAEKGATYVNFYVDFQISHREDVELVLSYVRPFCCLK